MNIETKFIESIIEHKYMSKTKITIFIVLFSTFLIAILILVLGYLKLYKNYNKLLSTNAQLRIFDESSKQAEILGKYGSWTYNIKEDEFYFSENFYRLYGYNPHEDHLLRFLLSNHLPMPLHHVQCYLYGLRLDYHILGGICKYSSIHRSCLHLQPSFCQLVL